MKLTNEDILHLRAINIRKDNKNFIVEDCETQEFYEMPRVCIDALELIKTGKSLGDIETRLIKEYPNEEINMVDFSNQLIDFDLIEFINDKKIERKINETNSLGFLWIPPIIGKAFFNRFTIFFYCLLLFVNLFIFVFNPSVFPHYKDLFIFDMMSLNILALGMLSLVLVLIHEFGHILAIRSFHLPTRLEIGHRLYLIVFETDLSLAWKLPPEKRNILYLAGVFFDNVILFLALLIKLYVPLSSDLLSGLVGLIIFDSVVRIIYQACIYMKTDFYFLFQNMTGSYNIMENGIYTLKALFSRSKVKEDLELFEGEEQIVKWYSIFYIVGVAITIGLLFVYYLPQLIYMGKATLPGINNSIGDAHFWDAVIFILQIVVMLGFLLYSFYKSYRERIVEN
ncbi:hypothetical protein ACLM5H_08270 [Fredinandcohnia humi]